MDGDERTADSTAPCLEAGSTAARADDESCMSVPMHDTVLCVILPCPFRYSSARRMSCRCDEM